MVKKVSKQLRRMSNDELDLLLSTDDEFVIDCLLDQVPKVKTLLRERDKLKQQVTNLANFNYAREPEFVRDRAIIRETLEDVSTLTRRLTTRHLEPVLNELEVVQHTLSTSARNYEEQSESMAQNFLEGSKSYDQFIEDYIGLRKQTRRLMISADKLAKYKDGLADNVTKPFKHNSPVPAPRRRKRVSFNE